jgi:hypothetical protein
MVNVLQHYPSCYSKDNILLQSSTQLFYPYRLHIMSILFKETEGTFGELKKDWIYLQVVYTVIFNIWSNLRFLIGISAVQ